MLLDALAGPIVSPLLVESPGTISAETPVWTIVSTIVGVIGLLSIVIAWLQLRDATLWNKRNAAFSYFPRAHELEDVERELEEVCRFSTRPRTEPLTEQEAKALHGSALAPSEARGLRPSKQLASRPESEIVERYCSAGRQLKYYLSSLERYSTAINGGVVDEATAIKLFRSKFITVFGKAGAYVRYAQRKQEGAYSELERVVRRWSRV